jgi:hypothetical protein
MSKFDKLTEAYLKVVNESDKPSDHTDNFVVKPPELNAGWKAIPVHSEQKAGKETIKYELLKDFKTGMGGVIFKKGHLVDSDIVVMGHGVNTKIPKEILKEKRFIKVTAIVNFEITKA